MRKHILCGIIVGLLACPQAHAITQEAVERGITEELHNHPDPWLVYTMHGAEVFLQKFCQELKKYEESGEDNIANLLIYYLYSMLQIDADERPHTPCDDLNFRSDSQILVYLTYFLIKTKANPEKMLGMPWYTIRSRALEYVKQGLAKSALTEEEHTTLLRDAAWWNFLGKEIPLTDKEHALLNKHRKIKQVE